MYNALYVSSSLPLNDFDIFVKNNINGINTVFMDSEYFLDLCFGITSSENIKIIHDIVSIVFNNAIYKMHAPICSSLFTDLIIEKFIDNEFCLDSLKLLWHYDIDIFLTDPDRLNNLISIKFNNSNNLLSAKIDENKILNMYQDTYFNYKLVPVNNTDYSFANIIFNSFIDKYVDKKDLVKLHLMDNIPLHSNKNKYSELY